LAEVPSLIAGYEHLARYCSPKDVKNGVKERAFYASKRPFEISVDRMRYCQPEERARREGKTFVRLLCDSVRTSIGDALVSSKMPPAEHALISHVDPRLRSYETKIDLQSDADDWAKFSDFCARLAKLSEVKE
jgi:hypothetical protein